MRRGERYCLVPRRGLEPPSLAAYGPEPYVVANFTTWANGLYFHVLFVFIYQSGRKEKR